MAVSLEKFVERLEISGLLSADEVSALTDKLPADRRPKDVRSLAKLLVNQGKLTKYQAAAVYQKQTAHLVVGDYVVLDKLGQGGMGQVLKAQHRRMDRIVALKILPTAKVESKTAIDRFHQEVRAAAKLTHPNIVTAFDAGEQDGLHYLVMEYVDGKDLSSIVREQGRMPVEQAVDCVIQAATGLGYAHEKEVVHRDIKPGNLLLSKNGVVKVLDMGLARLTGGGDLNKTGGEGEGLTQTGQIMGTIDYMAPEQALDTRRADHRADIYALGCTLYRLITGEAPFEGDTLMMKLLAHREQPTPSLRGFRPETSPALDAVYQRMMAKNPDDRQQSMAEVVEQLQAAVVSRAAPAPARPVAARATSRELEKPSMDSALSAFLQNEPQTAVTSVPPSTEQSAFEETMNHGSSDEGTGEEFEELEEVADTEPIGTGDDGDASSRQVVAATPKGSRPTWFIPAIAGGALAVLVFVGLIVIIASRDDPGADLAGGDGNGPGSGRDGANTPSTLAPATTPTDTTSKLVRVDDKPSSDDRTIPAQLPDPDGNAADSDQRVKVFILAGDQSMLEFGAVAGNKPGTLETLVRRESKFQHLVDNRGEWTSRDDVQFCSAHPLLGQKMRPITIGNAIGVDLQFGHIVGHYFDEQVLVIRSAGGNRALGWDFRPPSSGKLPDIPENLKMWEGREYNLLVEGVHETLNNLEAILPGYKGQGYDVAGFCWFQGVRDGLTNERLNEYERNLVNLIKDVRTEFNVPNLPVVVATVAVGGKQMNRNFLTILKAQMAVSDPAKYPEHAGNVLSIDTRDFWRSAGASPVSANSEQGVYYRNAETFMLVGDSLGRGMVELLEKR